MEQVNKYRIGKVYISRTTPEKTVAEIKKAIDEGRNEYIVDVNSLVTIISSVDCSY